MQMRKKEFFDKKMGFRREKLSALHAEEPRHRASLVPLCICRLAISAQNFMNTRGDFNAEISFTPVLSSDKREFRYSGAL